MNLIISICKYIFFKLNRSYLLKKLFSKSIFGLCDNVGSHNVINRLLKIGMHQYYMQCIRNNLFNFSKRMWPPELYF